MTDEIGLALNKYKYIFASKRRANTCVTLRLAYLYNKTCNVSVPNALYMYVRCIPIAMKRESTQCKIHEYS